MDIYLGSIYLFPYGRSPYCFLPCDGCILKIREYQALFALIGTTYGGDGKSTFALPNMQCLEPMPGVQYYIAVMGLFPARE